MIDDCAKAMELLEKMKAQLPIPARPGRAFLQAMRKNGMSIRSGQELLIESVLYLGDEGGIGCAIQLPDKGIVTIASLTHIQVEANHPLAQEIHAYQTERARKLAQVNRGQEPTHYTVRPHKKKRR
jgi:hypothetical protein